MEIEATQITAEPQNKVRASKNLRLASSAIKPPDSPTTNNTSEMITMETMPTPEIGLEDEPTKPAI